MGQPNARNCRDCGIKPARSPKAFYCEDCYLKGGRAKSVAARERNPELYRKRTREYMARQRLENAAVVNERKQRSRYQLREGQYDQMREAQDFRCKLCGKHEDELNRPLMVDHDHSCCDNKGRRACGRCNRGLLCGNCNWMLGLAYDDPEVLRSAADYIDLHRILTKETTHA